MPEPKRTHDRRVSGYLKPSLHEKFTTIATNQNWSKSQALNKAVALLIKNPPPPKKN